MSTTKKTNQVNKPMIIPGPKLHVAKRIISKSIQEVYQKELIAKGKQAVIEIEGDQTID